MLYTIVSNPYRKILSKWDLQRMCQDGIRFQSLQEDSKLREFHHRHLKNICFQSLQEDSKLFRVVDYLFEHNLFPILTGRF